METAADLIKRDITPICWPGGDIFRQLFAASPDPVYQELSRRIIIPNDWDVYFDLVDKVTSTGLYCELGDVPWYFEDYKEWYRSSDTIAGDNPYAAHLVNKKWPLRKVL